MNSSNNDTHADAIIFGGDIVTVDDNNPTAEALAFKDGKITALGKRDHVLQKKGPLTEMIDLEGKTLMPGLIEPHSHPVISALLYDWVDVGGINNSSGAEVMERLRAAASEANPGEWIAAFGYDPVQIRDLEGLNADFLDEISTENPIFVMIQSMHTVYVNHKAFEAAGITKDTPAPEGGKYVKDKDGNLTGMILELAAVETVLAHLIKNYQENDLDLMEKQIMRYARVGYTTVGALGIFPVLVNWESIIKEMVESEACPIRMSIMDKALEMERGSYIDFGANSARLSSGGAKFWYDGSFPSGTVYLEEPYLNSELMQERLSVPKDTRGYSMMPKETLQKLVQKYHDEGRQVSIHAHGDRAIRDVIDVYEAVLKVSPRNDHRHRIEHCGLFPIDEAERAANLGLTPSWHMNYVYYFGEAMRDEIIGPERANILMPVAAANKAGLRSSLHNDSPMFPADPFRLMETSVTRKTRKGAILGEDQAITIDEAIKAVTINAAYQLFLDDKVGSLEVGKLADMVVLSENPLKIDPNQLHQIQVIDTYREGRRLSLKCY